MVDNFIQAKCHEWVLLASLMLKKFTVLNEIADHVRLGKYPIDISSSIKNGLKELEGWSEHEW
jgi:hypothetical protein